MKVRALPPLLFRQTLLLAFLLGVGAYWFVWCWSIVPLLLVDSRLRDFARATLVLLAVVAGWGWAWHVDVSNPDLAAGVYDIHKKYMVTATVADVRGMPGDRLRVVLEQVSETKTGRTFPGNVVWTWRKPVFRPVAGDMLEMPLRMRPITTFRNGDEAGFLRLRRLRGEAWQAFSEGSKAEVVRRAPSVQQLDVWREQLRTRLEHFLFTKERLKADVLRSNTSGHAFIPALLFGDRTFLEPADVERLSMAGLSHSIALSGQHLAVTGLFAVALMWGIGRVWPAVFVSMPRTLGVAVLSVPLALGYWWIGGGPASLTRAGLMLVFWVSFVCLRRPAAFPDAMLAALAVMVVVDPACMLEVGVQLSFVAVAGIALLLPSLHCVWSATDKAHPQPLWQSTARASLQLCMSVALCSVAAQVATLPITARVFGEATLWSWLNVLWLPVLGAVVLPLAFVGLLFLCVGAESIAGWLLAGATLPCDILLEGLRLLETYGMSSHVILRPHGASMLGMAVLLVAMAWLVGRKANKATVCMVLLGGVLLWVGPALRIADGFSQEARVRLLDVGQGQAVLIEAPGQRRAIVDGGGFNIGTFDVGRSILLPALTDNRPPRIDIVGLTHPDADHLYGLCSAAPCLRPRLLVLARGTQNGENTVPALKSLVARLNRQGTAVVELEQGEQVRLGVLGIHVLAPPPGGLAAIKKERDKNDGLMVRVTHLEQGLAVIPGDASLALQNTVVAALGTKARSLLASEVLIAAHHGSKNNVSEAFIDAVQPKVVLASCGQGNRFVFPSKRLRDALALRGIALHSTADRGAITVRWALP